MEDGDETKQVNASRSVPTVTQTPDSDSSASTVLNPLAPNPSIDQGLVQQIRDTNVENLKVLLTGSALGISNSGTKSLIHSRSNSEQLASIDGLVSRQRSTEVLLSKTDLHRIVEDSMAEDRNQTLNKPAGTSEVKGQRLEVVKHMTKRTSRSANRVLMTCDKTQQIDLVEILGLESAAYGRSKQEVMSHFKTAVSIAITTNSSFHHQINNFDCDIINDMAGVVYSHPSDNLQSYCGYSDGSTQTRIDLLLNIPSQCLEADSISADSATQCEINIPLHADVGPVKEEMAPKRSKKSISIHEVDAWSKGSSDVAVSCYMAPNKPICLTNGERPDAVDMARLVEDTSAVAVDNTDVTRLLSSDERRDLMTYINLCVTQQITGIQQGSHAILQQGADATLQKNSEAGEQMAGIVADWLVAIGFLNSLQLLLVHFFKMVEETCRSVTRRTVGPQSRLLPTRLTNAAAKSIRLPFISVLPDSRAAWNGGNRGLSREVPKQENGGQVNSEGSSVNKKGVAASLNVKTNWKKLKFVALEREKTREELIVLKRMKFLDDLMNELTPAESGLLQTIFMTVNKSKTVFIAVNELRDLLTESLSQNFTVSITKKIMRDIDVDEDGCLCLLDFFSIFYLTEIYLQALGDGFRDSVLANATTSFTSSHAVVFIAISQLCINNDLRLALDKNVFIKQCEMSNMIRMKGQPSGITAHDLDISVCRLYCFSLLGLDNAMFQTLSESVNDFSRLKLSPLWSDETKVKAVYDKQSHQYGFANVVSQVFDTYKQSRGGFFRLLTDMAKPTLPAIKYRPKKSRIDFEPPYVFCNQGKEVLIRKLSTNHSFDNRSKTPAQLFCTKLIQARNRQGDMLTKVFSESCLFHNRRLHNLVRTFCYNCMAMWPRPKPMDAVSGAQATSEEGQPHLSNSSVVKGSSTCLKGAVSNIRPYTLPDVGEQNIHMRRQMRHSLRSLCTKYNIKPWQMSWRFINKARAVRYSLTEEHNLYVKTAAVQQSVKLWKEIEAGCENLALVPQLYEYHTTYMPHRVDKIHLPPIPTHRGSRPGKKLGEHEKNLPPFYWPGRA